MTQVFTADDRLAILTACSTLGKSRESDVEPLGPVGWSKVAIWLHDQGQTPATLLEGVDTGETFDQRIGANLANLPYRAAAAALEIEDLQHRGIWNLVRIDDDYPDRWRQRLKSHAPPVLFGAGPIDLIDQPGIGVVGSRDIDSQLEPVATVLGSRIAETGQMVISGGARGIDRLAMNGAVERGGRAVGLLSGDLERILRQAETRRLVEEGAITLAVSFHPQSGFSTGNAMGRNKLIHALADAVIVVSTSEEKGGTWQGAIENLTNGWSPLLVWNGEGAPSANNALIAKGGYPVNAMPVDGDELLGIIEAALEAPPLLPPTVQGTLFS